MRRVEQHPNPLPCAPVAPPAPTYDLVLLLDAEADASAHERILAEARAVIAAGGELVRDDAWGDRALTYPIAHKATARYHLLQFRTPAPALLEQLDRVLRFADEVVRFRIVRLRPGTPEAPRSPGPGATAAGVPEGTTGETGGGSTEGSSAESPAAAAPVVEAAQPA